MNRFYKPSAPRYTSQFVEDTVPFDLMFQVGQQKLQQQANMASAIGEFQGIVAATPHGERTVRMAPLVRNDWNNRLSEWSANNMDKYDSPQAISELVRLRTEFLNDPDVALMRMDAEYGDKERQSMKTKMDMGDIDPNVNPQTGQVKQFMSSRDINPNTGERMKTDPYKGYDPLIKYQDVPTRIYTEFDLVPTIKKGVTYNVTEPHPLNPDEKIIREVQRNIDITNMDEWENQLENMSIRGVEGKEDWARYQNEYVKSRLGRPWTKDEWKDYLTPFARQKVVTEDMATSRWRYPSETGAGSGTSQTPLGGVDLTTMQAGPGERTIAPRGEIRRSSWKKNIEDPLRLGSRMAAFKTLLSETVEGFDEMTPDQQKDIMEKYHEEGQKPVKVGYSWWGKDVETDANALFAGAVNDDGSIIHPVGASIIKGISVWDMDTGEMIQGQKEKEKMFNIKDNSVRIIGRTQKNNIPYQIAPGVVVADVFDNKSGKSRMIAIQLPGEAEKQRRTWNWYSFMRAPTTGVGDMFTAEVRYNPSTQQISMPIYHDISESGTEGKWENVNPESKDGVYIIPRHNKRTGEITYRVFNQNPSETNYLDDSNPYLIGVYNYNDYQGMTDEKGEAIDPIDGLESQIIYDAYINR